MTRKASAKKRANSPAKRRSKPRAARGKRVLELGSGTGRIAIPMAKRGCAVTGVDFLLHMVRLAREKARRAGVRVRWVEGDVLTAPVPGRAACSRPVGVWSWTSLIPGGAAPDPRSPTTWSTPTCRARAG
ncbi:MAG: class I SAM-dependent methyltransferase [Elusimicrobia bacterium]|nr:class I SAM-dependent methyltransferase [Elusimicrobiota bacterium]